MRNTLKDQKRAVHLGACPKWLIILLLILSPPVGFYFALKYKHDWLKVHPFFSVCVGIYTFILILGMTLAGSFTGQVDGENITTKRITETQTIKYLTRTVSSGEPQNGENGTKTIEYEIKYLDGKEIARVILHEEITREPIEEIIVVGGDDAKK